MRVDISPLALEASERVPAAVRKPFFKQLELLEKNRRHPSLRAKRFKEGGNYWQARVNRDWRFYFAIETTSTTSSS
jgi:mRNA-degrading endonuclease RelE of RelBE toxin-antitoxin system